MDAMQCVSTCVPNGVVRACVVMKQCELCFLDDSVSEGVQVDDGYACARVCVRVCGTAV